MKQTLFNILLPGCSFFMLLPGVMPIAILSGWKPARTITVIMHVRATVLFYQPWQEAKDCHCKQSSDSAAPYLQYLKFDVCYHRLQPIFPPLSSHHFTSEKIDFLFRLCRWSNLTLLHRWIIVYPTFWDCQCPKQAKIVILNLKRGFCSDITWHTWNRRIVNNWRLLHVMKSSAVFSSHEAHCRAQHFWE